MTVQDSPKKQETTGVPAQLRAAEARHSCGSGDHAPRSAELTLGFMRTSSGSADVGALSLRLQTQEATDCIIMSASQSCSSASWINHHGRRRSEPRQGSFCSLDSRSEDTWLQISSQGENHFSFYAQTQKLWFHYGV